MHWEAMIVRTWRPLSSEFGDALAGHDHVNLEAVSERVCRYTWRPRSCALRDALGGHDRTKLGMLGTVDWEVQWELRLYSLVNM